MKPRKVTLDEVEIIVETREEDTSIEGNVLASGDAAVDQKAEQWVRDQVANGNEWAWCSVRVSAVFQDFRGTDHLGCCSYKSEAEFRMPGGYFEDMVQNALEDLNQELFRTAARLPRGRRTNPATGSQGADECFCCGGRFNATEHDKRPICGRCK